MVLAHIRIGIPMMRFKVCIEHATPRRPTAFERVLIKLCDRFGKHPQYAENPVEGLFVKFLRVPDPAPLLSATISDLVSLDVIRCNGDVDSPGTLPLQKIEITERGRQMLSEDRLPAKPQKTVEMFSYDPIRERLLFEGDIKAYRPIHPEIHLDEKPLLEVFPEEAIRSEIECGNYPWWTSASKILSISHEPDSVMWKDTPAEIVAVDGKIAIALKYEMEAAYINALGVEEIRSRFLDPILGGGEMAEADLWPLVEDLGEGSDSSGAWIPLKQASKEFSETGGLWLLDGDSKLFPCPPQADGRKVVVRFGRNLESEDAIVAWNEQKNGCLVEIRGRYPLTDTIFSSDRYMYKGRKARLKIGLMSYEFPWIRRSPLSGEDPAIGGTLGTVVSILRNRGDSEDHMIPAFWQTEQAFYAGYAAYLDSRGIGFPKVLDRLRDAREWRDAILGKTGTDTWDSVIADTCIEYVNNIGVPLSCDALKKVIDSICGCGMNPEVLEKRVVGVVLEQIQPPGSLSELKDFLTVFGNAGRPWMVRFPSPLYPPEIVKAIFDGFTTDEVSGALEFENDFHALMKGLKGICRDINAAIGETGLGGLNEEKDFLALLKSPNLAKIGMRAEEWAKKYALLRADGWGLESCLPGSILEDSNRRVEEIRDLINRLESNVPSNFQFVYVLDTSALLDKPQILKTFQKTDYLIVSKRVIEELDDKKREETLRGKVSEAIKALRDFPNWQIRFCNGDMSLLPPDYRTKGDNLILSVAVRFRKSRPVLLTNDGNLALKSRAEGITAWSVNEYEQEMATRKPLPVSGNSPRPDSGSVKSKGKQERPR